MEKTAKLEAIKSWMKSNKFTQKALADKLGVSATVINNLLAGRVEFGLKTAEAWHEKFGIDQDFLLRGEGELFHREKTLDERIMGLACENTSADLTRIFVENLLTVESIRSTEKNWFTTTASDDAGKKTVYIVGKSDMPDFHERFARWLMAGCPLV